MKRMQSYDSEKEMLKMSLLIPSHTYQPASPERKNEFQYSIVFLSF